MFVCVCVYVLVTQLCPTLCDPMDCTPPGSSFHGILQAGMLEWVAIPFPTKGSNPGSPAQQANSLLSEPPIHLNKVVLCAKLWVLLLLFSSFKIPNHQGQVFELQRILLLAFVPIYLNGLFLFLFTDFSVLHSMYPLMSQSRSLFF